MKTGLPLASIDRLLQYIPRITPTWANLWPGHKPGREISAERTVTANPELAIDDVAVAPTIYQRTVEK